VGVDVDLGVVAAVQTGNARAVLAHVAERHGQIGSSKRSIVGAFYPPAAPYWNGLRATALLVGLSRLPPDPSEP
jgi:hypothetical protein